MSKLREEMGIAYDQNGFPDPDHEGGIAFIGGELPSWLSIEEVEDQYGALQEQLDAIHEPPIAFVTPVRDKTAGIDDFRVFMVEFEPEATAEHMVSALQVVVGAIRRLREEQG